MKRYNILKDLTRQIDVSNTINGGSAPTKINFEKHEDNLTIKLSAPGIIGENYDIYIRANQLIVYSYFYYGMPSSEEQNQFPFFSRKFEIPNFVNPDDIEAIDENDELKIIMPFNPDKVNDVKRVDIKHYS